MRSLLTLIAIFCALALTAQEVIITGIIDGTQSASPRAVELYINGTVDLSGYTLERYANAATSPTDATSLSGTYTDEFVYVINSDHLSAFDMVFGSAGDFSNRISGTNLFGNGNDAFVVVLGGTILDQTGGEIGSSTDIFEDSYLYRNDNTGPDGGWVAANWSIPGNDLLDGLSFAEMGNVVPFGTYTTTPPGPSVAVGAGTNLDEDGTNGNFTLTLSEVAAGAVTINYSLSGTATPGADFVDVSNGSVVINNGDLTTDVNLNVIDDAESEPLETITLTITGISDMTYSAGSPATINIIDNEAVSAIGIHLVQGSGTTSPLVGQTISVEGIVVGDFQGGSGVGLGGFFIQEEDADADADPSTSEGIWIFDGGTGTDVNAGDLVAITGVVEESSDLTQINITGGGASVNVLSSNNTLPTAASLDLPVAAPGDYEPYEGMLTTVIDAVHVTETFGLARFGEFDVSEGERLIQFTECNFSDPGALAAYENSLDLRRLTIDDGRSGDNNYPIILGDGSEMSATNSLRAGTILSGLTGIVDERFTGYRFQATGFSRTDANPRPAAAPAVGGNLTVVSANVLNYFTTLGSRGADNATEFDRQEAKIVNAIIALDADILGLVEIENISQSNAIQTLITAISDAGGPTYTYVNNPNPGGDDIMVALIYKAAVVEETGTAANLTTPTAVFQSNRVPLAQTFRIIEVGNPNFGQEITVCVNHWKSKGGSCGAGDDDNGGAGSCNGTRDAAAQAITSWLAGNPTGVNEMDQLIIGDLNAYSQEDPLLSLEAAGYVNTVRTTSLPGSFPCGSTPSYVFRGEWGSLDHIFASSSLATKVTGATPWQVNAAEPTALDYDTQFNNPALYADDFYRFSDHDPIIIGLDLGATLPAELTTFSGTQEAAEVLLAWTTSVEVNTDRFIVERRNANGMFGALGEVTAAGTSSVPTNYNFTDATPASGQNEYRLRIIDLDGLATFSEIITVNFDPTSRIEVVRNGQNSYRLSGAAPGTSYLLTDAAGAIIRRSVVTAATQDVDGSGLPTGIYFLVVENNGRNTTFKLVLR